MHRVMLIDDDIPMLKVLQQMIEWENLDLHVAGSTYSSVKALQMFRETLPDIVITDIGLPKKSGIELAAEFTAIKPEVRIIFLTCHEDFHYAQAAVKLDADDYLLKDKLSAEQLQESLRKSISRLKSDAGGNQLESAAYSGGLLRRALLQLIMDGADLERARPHASRLGIAWNYPWFMMGIVNLRYCAYEPFYDRSNLPLIRYAVYNIALEIAEAYEGITPFIEQEKFIILYNYRHNLAGNDAAYLQSYLEELISQSSTYLKLTLQIVAAADRLALQAVGAVYQQIRTGRPEFYSQEQLVMAPCGQLLENIFYPAPQGLADPFRNSLERAILEKEVNGIHLLLAHFGREAQSRRTEPGEWIEELVQLMRGAEMLFARRKPDEDIYYYLGESRTLEDALGLASGRLEQLVREQWSHPGLVTASEPRLQVIQAFIDQHLTENITSIDIAQYLYLNPSYFSRYFKRLTGLSFTDYVHQYKMKIAANMLKNSGLTLEMLAMGLGYSDRAYFSKVFKKYIGVTPSDYKQKKQLRRTP